MKGFISFQKFELNFQNKGIVNFKSATAVYSLANTRWKFCQNVPNSPLVGDSLSAGETTENKSGGCPTFTSFTIKGLIYCDLVAY